MISWLRRERSVTQQLFAGAMLGVSACAIHNLTVLAISALGLPLPTATGVCWCQIFEHCGLLELAHDSRRLPSISKLGLDCDLFRTFAEQLIPIAVGAALLVLTSKNSIEMQ